jgi:hypothetical protein
MNRVILILIFLLLLASGVICWLLWPKPPVLARANISAPDSATIAEQARIGFVRYDYDKFVKEFGQTYRDTTRHSVNDTNWVEAFLEAITDTSHGEIILPEMSSDVSLNFSGVDSLSQIEYQIGIALHEKFIPPPINIRRHAVIDTFILDFPPPDTITTGVDPDLLWKVGGGGVILGMLIMALAN